MAAAPLTASDFRLSDFALTVVTGYMGVFVAALVLGPTGDVATLIVGALFAQYFGHLLGLWIVVRRRGSSFAGLGLHVEPSDGLYLLGGFLLQIVLVYAFIPVVQLIGAEGPTQSIIEQIPNIHGTALRAGLVLSMTLLIPVTEELMFRGLLPKVLGRWMGRPASFALAALIFAAFHLLSVTDENWVQNLVLLVPQLFIVGLVLGWQTMRRGRLGVSIFIHSGFNLVAVLALLFAPEMFG